MHLLFWKEVYQMPFSGKQSSAYLSGKEQHKTFYSKFSHKESNEKYGAGAPPWKDSRGVSPLQTACTAILVCEHRISQN